MLHRGRHYPAVFSPICAALILVFSETGNTQQNACAALAAADVANGGTLAADTCYEARNPLSVTAGTLTIEPGVRIAFADNGFLTIATGGRLSARGTAAGPITFTSIDAAGSWRGIGFTDSRSADNVLHYVTIENAGSRGWNGAAYSTAALQLEGNTLVDIENSTITGSGGQGINVYAGAQMIFENNRVENNAVAAWVHPDAAGFFAGNNVFDGNTDNVVRVGFGNSDSVDTAQTWRRGVPFEVQDRFFIRAALTLEPGTRIAFRTDVQVHVVEGGSLTAVGTADSPIILTDVENLAGNWQGLRIETSAAANRFDHVVFENGGSRPWTGAPDSSAMVYLEDSSRAQFANTTFRGSDHYGLWVPAGADISGFSGNTFTDNARAMIVHPNRAGAISADNTFADNAENKVRVTFGNNDSVTDAQTWNDFDAPFYVMDRTFISAPLTIAAGTQLEFAQNASLRVRDEGSLRTAGVAEDPIVFRGGQDFSGYWFGIEYNTLQTGNVLEHVVIRNGGSGDWVVGAAGSIHIDADGFANLMNVTIENTEGYAVIIRRGARISCSDVDDGGAQFLVWDDQGPVARPACP